MTFCFLTIYKVHSLGFGELVNLRSRNSSEKLLRKGVRNWLACLAVSCGITVSLYKNALKRRVGIDVSFWEILRYHRIQFEKASAKTSRDNTYLQNVVYLQKS